MESSVIFKRAELPAIRWSHLVPLLLLMNLADCCLTLFWVAGGHATEANVVMAALLQLGPVPFAVVKTALVMAGAWVLFHRRHRPLAQAGLLVVTVAYLAVLVHHCRFIVEQWA